MRNTSTAGNDARRQSRQGLDVLRDPILNKGTGFTEAERAALGLRGLLPPHVHSQADDWVERNASINLQE